jgi:AmmeMemoRadiSam system protein B
MSVPVVRRPAVAGYFYPDDPRALTEAVDSCLEPAARQPVRAMMAPHGSLRHAGAVTGAVFARAVIPARCILVGPSHAPSGLRWSLMTDGWYRTPLGDVPIDTAVAAALHRRCPFLEPDAGAQRGEHALEVLVPFLQRCGPTDLAIVPIILGQDEGEELADLAAALAQALQDAPPALLIASADLSQQEPAARAAEQDRQVLQAVCALDSAGLLGLARARRRLMCGAGATACVLAAAKALGARAGTVVRYSSSAACGGDPDAAVGYAGVLLN